MNRKKNMPQIRYQNYEDNWDVEKLINIFGTIRNAFVGTATPYYVENGNFYLESNNVKNGKINYNSQIFINDEFYEKQRDKWLKTNDIVMVQSGHVGHTAVIPEELNNTAAHALIVFTDYKKEVNPHFLNYQFQSNGKRKELDLISTGNTIKHILASEMKNFKMDFPTSEEQYAIGSLFRNLDDLLASYKDNLANYQSLKATMLSKMFPKAGQTVPEIRLDGFEGEWEIRKLSEVSEVYDGTHQTPNYTESGVKFLSVENISTLESEKYISEEDFEKDFKVFPEFGDVLMTRIGSIGVPNIVKTNEKIAFYVSLALLKPKKETNSLFMKSSIESNPFQEELWKKTLHIAFPKKINKNDISQSTIKCPSYEEQQAIGSYFSNLDNLINSHQEKISQLETLKKKLLQDMFI